MHYSRALMLTFLLAFIVGAFGLPAHIGRHRRILQLSHRRNVFKRHTSDGYAHSFVVSVRSTDFLPCSGVGVPYQDEENPWYDNDYHEEDDEYVVVIASANSHLRCYC